MAVNKVLVCDDSATDLINIKNIVEGAGCITITASSGVEALDQGQGRASGHHLSRHHHARNGWFRGLPEAARRSRPPKTSR